MRTSALFGVKKSGFFEIYDMSARTRGLSQCGHFADKEGGGQFCAKVFNGRPLSKIILHFVKSQLIM